jgi:PAS domain S-box-containing protein
MQNDELRRMQVELDATRARYFDLYDLAPMGYVTLSAEGLILEANLTAATLLGVPRGDLIKRPLTRFILPEDQNTYHRHHRQLLETGASQTSEIRMRRAKADSFWARVDATLAQTTDSVPVCRVTLSDISERVRSEVVRLQIETERAEELQRANEKMQRSNADLEQFAYVASHDLQEPLRAVAGMVQLLQQRYQGQLDARADQYIFHAVEGATRMQTLIDDLLTFSRVGTKGKALAPTDAGQALQAALDNLRAAIDESGAIITHGALPTVMADAMQLAQLFQNLIGNAIKFRGERPPRIDISAQSLAEGWRFAVRDNGIGIEAQYFERIFAVFQRLHTRREYPGTGIGLAICKKIVERHGGQIWVKSQLGQGSTFYFTLP